ncbi:hypothetical protein [Hyphomicrobium sp.]|uniref:hypothetical protein n=1 Tax=Hyphomicrobium sp. TaxID=82 RepID=UPI0025C5F5BB|nr:hypothetical protein [Hyphomicrobium sp.]
MLIRNETAGDIPAISRLVTEAFLTLTKSASERRTFFLFCVVEAGDAVEIESLERGAKVFAFC